VGMFAVQKKPGKPARTLDERSFHVRRLGEIPGMVDEIERRFGNGESKDTAG